MPGQRGTNNQERKEVEQQANLILLRPTNEPTVVGVEEGPNGVGVPKEVVGQADNGRTGPPPPVACGPHAERTNHVQPHDLVQDVVGQILDPRFEESATGPHPAVGDPFLLGALRQSSKKVLRA